MVAAPPAIVIAAPASGSGKTTLATGLIGALRQAGHRIAPFKVGPDFIDPGYHAVAAGRPGRNLDPNLVGEHRVAPLFSAGSVGADIAVIEGVMGLFDGRISADMCSDHGGYGSTAHVAALLGAPVVVIVDASGYSHTIAAILHGLRSFDSDVTIAGVVLNRVGSDRHEQVLRDACEYIGLPVFGVLRRNPELAVPARHLGLIPALEHGRPAYDAVAAMAAIVRECVDLSAIVAHARSAVDCAPWSPNDEVSASAPGCDVSGSQVRVAVAGGAAFTFGYAEQSELLKAAGAQVVSFDPLNDEHLPSDTNAIIIGGGFPEEHVHELTANTSMLDDIAAHAHRGTPIAAECAGLLYLSRDLDGHRLAGVIDTSATFGTRLILGYRDAVATHDSVLYQSGERTTGHEFHRSLITRADSCEPAWAWRHNDATATDGVVTGSVHASYLHTHPAGNPASIARFVDAAARVATSARGTQ